MAIEVLGPGMLDVSCLGDRMSVAAQVFDLVTRVYPLGDPEIVFAKLGDLTFIEFERKRRVNGIVSISWEAPLETPPLNTGWLDLLDVSPKHRGKGIGSSLTDRAIRTMQQEGLGAIGLASAPNNENFWRKQGFSCCEPQPPDAHCMNPVMVKFLRRS